MSIAFVQQKTGQSTTSVSSFTTAAMTVTAGNTLAAASSANIGDPTTQAVSDSQGDVFTAQIKSSSSADQSAQWDVADAAVGGSTTFTVTVSSGSVFLSLGVHEYSGVAEAGVESTTRGDGADSSPTPGVLAPPSAGDLYLSAWTHSGTLSQTFTPNSGWTLRANLTNTANMPLGAEQLIGSGSQTGSVTLVGGAATWDIAALALRAADVGAPDPNAQLAFIVSGDRP